MVCVACGCRPTSENCRVILAIVARPRRRTMILNNFHHSCHPTRLATVEVFLGSWRVNRRFAANPTHAVPHAVAADPKFEFKAKKGRSLASGEFMNAPVEEARCLEERSLRS